MLKLGISIPQWQETDLDVFLGDDIEDLGTVSQETLDHLQDIVCEQRNVQLVNKHLQPLASGKRAAVLAIASDHGREQCIQVVVDPYANLRVPRATLLPSLDDDIESELQHPLFLEELLSLSQETQIGLPGVVGL